MQGEEKVSGSKELLFPSVQNNDLSVYSPAQLAVQLKNSFVTHPFVIITEKAHMENCLRYILRLVRGLHRIGDNLEGSRNIKDGAYREGAPRLFPARVIEPMKQTL